MALPSSLVGCGSATLGLCSSCLAREASFLQSGSGEVRPTSGHGLSCFPGRGESLRAVRTLSRALAFTTTRGTLTARSCILRRGISVSRTLFSVGLRNGWYCSHPWGTRDHNVSGCGLLWVDPPGRMPVGLSQVCRSETATLGSIDEHETSTDKDERSSVSHGWEEVHNSLISDDDNLHTASASPAPADIRRSGECALVRKEEEEQEEEEKVEEADIFEWGPALADIFDLSGVDILDPEQSLDVLREKAAFLWIFLCGVAGLVDHIGRRVGNGELKLSVRIVGWRRIKPHTAGIIVACIITTCAVVLATVKLLWRLLDADAVLAMSLFLVMWPRVVAVALGAFGLSEVLRRRRSEVPSHWKQVVMLLTASTWLILVPHGLINGYVDVWPLAFSAVYVVFFYMGSVRRVLDYGQLTDRFEDKQWQSAEGQLSLIGFVGAVVLGHWLAAWEAHHPLVNIIPFVRIPASLLALAAFRMHVQASRVLGSAFDRVVVPTELITYGPYAFVRHPIYLSYILLFASYCLGLNSLLSLALLGTILGLYYRKRIGKEEELLESAFGEEFSEYKRRTSYRLVPRLW